MLKAFNTPSSPKLAQLSLFYARNGRGKSTLTAVLRAARDGCSSTVLARTSLGNAGATPEVTLVSDSGNIRFKNGRWDRKDAPVEVFDTAFIADNIYAGELIELAHDRGLFSIIIGKQGVKLATHLDRFNVIARQTSAGLKAAEAALAEDKPADMELDEFFALGPNPEYPKRLDAAERALKAVQQADKITALKSPEEITAPALPADVASVLASTLADINAGARDRLLEHFKRFELDKRAEEWISYGLDHIHDDACAFCGREGVDVEGMVTLYSQIFGGTYKGPHQRWAFVLSYSPRFGISGWPPKSVPRLGSGRTGGMSMSAKISAAKRAAFLKAVAETGNRTIAAERAKVSRSWVLLHRGRDAGFDAAVRRSLDCAEQAPRLRSR